jgi:hypothetical protein
MFWMLNTEYSEPSLALASGRGTGGARGTFGGDDEGERGRLDPRREEPAPKGGVEELRQEQGMQELRTNWQRTWW